MAQQRYRSLQVVLLALLVVATTKTMGEVFGESSNDPSTATFDSDDDDDNNIDAQASSDEPDNEGADNYLDEAYEEPEGE